MSTLQTVNPVHRSSDLQQGLGSYYAYRYDDAERIYSIIDSMCWAAQVPLVEALDASKLFVRSICPVTQRRPFLPVSVDENTYINGQKQVIRFGDNGYRFGDHIYFGLPATTVTGAIKLPDGVVDVDTVCDLPVDASTILLKDEHFYIENGYLVFYRNIFELFPYEYDKHQRKIIRVYLKSAEIDRRYVQNRFGILTGTQGPSTEEFKDLVNLVADCIAEGTNYHRLARIVCKIFGVPCTEETETVEHLGVTDEDRWLATDKRVYRTCLQANFKYAPGDRVGPGTILSDAE